MVSFLQRVYDLFFSEEQMDKIHFSSLRQSMDLCQTSLDNLNPPGEPAWDVFRRKVSTLQHQLEAYRLQLSTLQTLMSSEAKSIRQVAGFKSLFLFISIYGVIDLFFISFMGLFSRNGQYSHPLDIISCPCLFVIAGIAFNIMSTFWSIRFISNIQNRTTTVMSDSDRYTKAINCVLLSLLLSLFIGIISDLLRLTTDNIPHIVMYVSSLLGVVLPFGPIIFTFYYFFEEKNV